MTSPAPVYGTDRGPLAIAHRGGAGLAGENTLDAFRRSHALGIRYLETDVRATADGEVVAYHDSRLTRVTPATGLVRTKTLRELTVLPVRGGGQIAALAEVIAAFPDAHLTIDVKEAAVIAPLARLLISTAYASRVCIAAMRGAWLRRLAELVGAELTTALPWRELAHLTAGAPQLRSPRATFAHVPIRLGRVPVFRRDLVARSHAAGLRVIVWTVNETATMHRLLDDHVDGIITDRPDLLREVLIARGQWHATGITRLPPTEPASR